MAYKSLATICSCNGNGFGYTISLSDDNKVYSFGSHSKHGHGHAEEVILTPKEIPFLNNIKQICCGVDHSICLDFEGNIFTFGANTKGQLGTGQGENVFSHTPLKVNVPPCSQISCGECYNICLTEDGKLYGFGYNNYGQLGQGIRGNRVYTYPVSINLELGGETIEFIECGHYHTFCKIVNGDVYSWGCNNFGQLGLKNTTENQKSPFKASTVWPKNIEVVDIKCSHYHTLVLTASQEVYSCGSNYCGQLGRRTSGKFSQHLEKIEDLSEIIRIECGTNQAYCINSQYCLYVFGNNFNGQLGLGDSVLRPTPIQLPLSDIMDVSSNGNSIFVKTVSNEIYGFGCNKSFQLGTETENDRQDTPIQLFQGSENIWLSNIRKSRAKSARK